MSTERTTVTVHSISINRDSDSEHSTLGDCRELVRLADDADLPDDTVLLTGRADPSPTWSDVHIVHGIGVRHMIEVLSADG